MSVTPKQVHEAVIAGDLKKVQELVGDNTMLLNAGGENNMSPLHYAANEGHADIAAWLVAQGADTQSIDTVHGATPLGWAAFYARTDIVKSLLDGGANRMHKNTYGETPLQVAQEGLAGKWEEFTGIKPEAYAAVIDLLK